MAASVSSHLPLNTQKMANISIIVFFISLCVYNGILISLYTHMHYIPARYQNRPRLPSPVFNITCYFHFALKINLPKVFIDTKAVYLLCLQWARDTQNPILNEPSFLEEQTENKLQSVMCCLKLLASPKQYCFLFSPT